LGTLRVEEGIESGRVFELSEGRSFVAGRDPRCPVRFEDPLASRHHFQIKEHRGAFYIRDLGSQNGTYLNEALLDRPRRLEDGDEIRAGTTRFIFHATAAAEEPAEDRPTSEEPVAESAPAAQNGEAAGTNGEAEENGTASGRVLGGYRLLKRIGRGGMGVVYRATQLSLGRDVALKVLSPTLTKDRTFVQLFIEEARAAGRLNHPNIVQVYDVASEGDLYFISMELMERGSIQDLLRTEGKIPVERAVPMILDAARGLQYAEGKKIVHRDIKPDNLMQNAEGVVKIADLGLAKSTHDSAHSVGDEGILGTPHFIAPEQALGREVDIRCDIYSLGATFYRMVTGATPFKGASAKEIVLKQIHEPPPPVREVNPELPEDVALVIEKMMRKEPDERHASAEALIQDLERIQRVHHYGERPSRLRRALVALVMLAILVVGARWLLRETPVEEPDRPDFARPENPEDAAERERERLALLESRANGEFLKVQLRENELGRTGDVAQEYRAVAERYPETRAGKDAAARADAILEEIREREAAAAAREREATERRARIDATWERIAAELDRSLGASEFSAGLAGVFRDPGLAELLSSEEHRNRLLEALERHLEAAQAHATAVIDEAKGLADASDFDAAAATIRAESHRFERPDAAEPVAPFEDLLARYAEVRTRLDRALDDVLRRERESILARDRDRFYPPVAAAFATAERHSRFDASLAALRDVAGSLTTEEYRARMAKILADLEPIVSLRKSLIDAINEGKLDAFEVPLATPIDDVEVGFPTQADGEKVDLQIRLPVGKVESRIAWSELSPTVFLRMVEDEALGFGDAEREAAVLTLLFQGELEEAERACRRWESLPDGPALLARVAREQAARALREEGSRHFREKRWSPALDALRRLEEEYADTREVLVHSDGTSHYFVRN